jgi:hypothetical protein
MYTFNTGNLGTILKIRKYKYAGDYIVFGIPSSKYGDFRQDRHHALYVQK